MFKHKSNKASKAAAKQQPVFKQDYFNNCHRTYSCIHCRAHLANHDELISKLFQGNHGRAYLFNKVVNIGCKQAVQRELLTGLHAVADIYCDNCGTTLGWKYEQAFVASQKYKEGKYIIELVHMLKENDWDLTSYNNSELLDHFTHHQLDSPALCDCTTVSLNGYSSKLSPNHLNHGRPRLAQIRASRSCQDAPTYQVLSAEGENLGDKLITSSASISNTNDSAELNGNNSENGNTNDDRNNKDMNDHGGGDIEKGNTN